MGKVVVYKSFNQYNYSMWALKVDYEKRQYTLYNGGECPISYDKKTSSKFIKEQVELLKVAGFKSVEK